MKDSDQLNLFGRPMRPPPPMPPEPPYTLYGGTPPHERSETSRAAAESMRPHVTEIAERVLAHLVEVGDDGATCDEVEQALELSHQTASARLRELVLKGRAEDSGQRRTTRSGRKAAVWVAVKAGGKPGE